MTNTVAIGDSPMSVYYHAQHCEGSDSRFEPAVCKNRAGFYIGMECFACHVNTRESGYYPDEASAWSDYSLKVKGLPITNPREPESEDDMIMRRLKAAGLDPKPDNENDLLPAKPAKVVITPEGAVDIELEDPLGAKLHIRMHITPWGLLGVTNTGFGSVMTEDGYMVIMPESDHVRESQNGLIDSMRELDLLAEEVEHSASDIHTESI